MPEHLFIYFLYTLHKDYGINQVDLKLAEEIFSVEDIETVTWFGYAKIRRVKGKEYLEINPEKEEEMRQIVDEFKSNPIFGPSMRLVNNIVSELIANGVIKPQHKQSTDASDSVNVSN